jgi:hypothetical protein
MDKKQLVDYFLPEERGKLPLNFKFISDVSEDSDPKKVKLVECNFHETSKYLVHLFYKPVSRYTLEKVQNSVKDETTA